MDTSKNLSVIDFFCGAGGFSEGFRQQGFDIIKGIDIWAPAINTFNYNFGLNDKPQNILDYWESIDLINELPNSDIIIGSPPCVSFSNSNRSGKADKSLGLKLTEVFLRIITVKKFQPNSVLKAWFMENVTNSLNYLARHYKFRDLNLYDWAKENGYSPDKIVISIEGNSMVINSAEYGSAQARKRAISGELIEKGKFIIPSKTHSINPHKEKSLLPAKTLGLVKDNLPKPNAKNYSVLIEDPLYPDIKIPLDKITDHFYDSGLYKSQWKNSRFMKQNHPYMGRMAFPENENKPSRTLTATNIGTSREAIIYKSEFNRIGDGEYRIPTVREMASLMGFPLTYQFLGKSETSKCRLVGNAVCPSVSRALASTVRFHLDLEHIEKLKIQTNVNLDGVINLNTFTEKKFNNPPIKKVGSRFRRHPFKYGNITVTLSNYDITNSKPSSKWLTSVQYGNGEGFPSENFPDNFYKKMEFIIEKFEGGKKFVEIIGNGFSEKIACSDVLQEMYEKQQSIFPYTEPTELIEEVANLINSLNFHSPDFDQNSIIFFNHKKTVPKRQILALYVINKICSKANIEMS